MGAAYGQGKYKVKGILAYNVLLTVLQSWSYNEAAKFEAITSICAVRDLIETIFVHRSVACAILGLFTC